jgi:hypothetical protein
MMLFWKRKDLPRIMRLAKLSSMMLTRRLRRNGSFKKIPAGIADML